MSEKVFYYVIWLYRYKKKNWNCILWFHSGIADKCRKCWTRAIVAIEFIPGWYDHFCQNQSNKKHLKSELLDFKCYLHKSWHLMSIEFSDDCAKIPSHMSVWLNVL